MGLFLTQLACRIASREKVIEALIKILSKKWYTLKSKTKVFESTGKENQFELTKAKNSWVQVFCPEKPDNWLLEELSKKLDIPIFQFHIHDGDFWMYHLFVSGELKDKYNPIPDYWERMSEKETKEWEGNVELLASIFNIKRSKINPYLKYWKDIKNNVKAFSTDEFPIKSEWSMVDFQRKFGIEYPNFDKPESLDLMRLTFEARHNKKLGILKKLFNVQ